MRKPILLIACFGILVLAIGMMNVSGSKATHASLVPMSPTHVHTVVPVLPRVSRHFTRINQLDPRQYANQHEYDAWSYSSCSTAAMTEVINSYGHSFRIHDILVAEQAVGAITSDAGLLDESGIERTMAQFAFRTSWGHQLSLNQVIATANSGTPVIVGFPPTRYPQGHLVVVLSGRGDTVFIADSSRFNRPQLTRQQFMAWWGGFSAVVVPAAQGGQR